MSISLRAEAESSNLTTGTVVRNLIIGVIFIAFSIPIVLIKLGDTLQWSWVRLIGSTSRTILNDAFGATSASHYLSFNSMWSIILKGLLVYGVALALLSLRHQRLDLFTSGVLSLALGTAVLNLLAWGVYLGLLLLTLLLFVARWILGLLGFILLKIVQFLGFIGEYVLRFFEFIGSQIIRFIAFLIASPWWIVAIVLTVALAVYLGYKNRRALLMALRMAFSMILGAAVSIGALLLLRWLAQVLAPLWAFLGMVFSAIFHFLGIVLYYLGVVIQFLFRVFIILLVVFLIGYVIWGVGSWVADLIKGAWNAGNGKRGVIIGALAIGTALALILLETNLLHTDLVPFFPPQVASFVNLHLHEVSPLFDLIVALIVIGISVIGVIRNLGQLQPEPSWQEYHTSIFMAGLGIIIGGALIFLAAAGGGDQS